MKRLVVVQELNPTVEENEVEQYLLNTNTKVISKEGDQKDGTYITVYGKELELDNGFVFIGKIKGTNEDIKSFLTFEEYFDGKEFKLK